MSQQLPKQKDSKQSKEKLSREKEEVLRGLVPITNTTSSRDIETSPSTTTKNSYTEYRNNQSADYTRSVFTDALGRMIKPQKEA